MTTPYRSEVLDTTVRRPPRRWRAVVPWTLILTFAAVAFGRVGPAPAGVEAVVTVDPTCTRRIAGISEFHRERYIALCDAGTNFEKRCGDPARLDLLVRDLGIRFGRRLGPVQGAVRWSTAVVEDPRRPGRADRERLRRVLPEGRYDPSAAFRELIGDSLDVAAHGRHNAFPPFMGAYRTPQSGDEYLPENVEAAAELSAAILRYDYGDFDRPVTYEPVNEPHWSFYRTDHLARWHLATMARVHADVPGVWVGGPCSSVAYFYRDGYRAFNGLRDFIDATDAGLDFYSFHVYDYLHWDGNDIRGRVTSGLPLEGVLDLVENYTTQRYGHEVPLVVSEHGGYLSGGDTAAVLETIGRRFFPGEGFAWEMEQRSVSDHIMVSSAIANTLTFMDHPHVLRKAVPFILLNAFGWDPRYYAVLYVPQDFQDTSVWIPTRMVDFYRMFAGVGGRRILARGDDPDIQVRAFRDGRQVSVMLNNLSDIPHTVTLDLPGAGDWSLRRLQRGPDLRPVLFDETVPPGQPLTLAGREAVTLQAQFLRAPAERRVVNERIVYGDRTTVAADPQAVFTLTPPAEGRVAYAVLRVGLSRPSGASPDVRVTLNGRPLAVPPEHGAARLDDGQRDYTTCKLIEVDPAWLPRAGRSPIRVAVSFPDGRPGTVGAVVLRVAVDE